MELVKIIKKIGMQFQNLDDVHPAFWPFWPRCIAACLICVAASAIAYSMILSVQYEELNQLCEKEESQKKEWLMKLVKIQNLQELRTQKEKRMELLAKLEQQFPDKASVDAVLSEINQAGINRALQFELFKPGEMEIKEFYAELPIAIKITGNYHALAGFVSDIANLSRLVVLDHVMISVAREGVQNFDAVIRVFRQLDQEELVKKNRNQDQNFIKNHG